MQSLFLKPPPVRKVFCNRTLNLRSIQAIGFDMDYTLVHYQTEAWERRAYEHTQVRLKEQGWPVEGLEFDPGFASMGLVFDLELGNIVKANRFGYIRRACHGTKILDHGQTKSIYRRTLVDLSEPRWVFMNTLFALSEACLYAQLVDRLDEGKIEGAVGYSDLYKVVRSSVDESHMEGTLKAEIVANPERFVELDPELPIALLDMKTAGKKLVLITNSAWPYTKAMLSYVLDRFLPVGMTFKDVFDLMIVSARKPAFFTQENAFFEITDDSEEMLRPCMVPSSSKNAYHGGHASLVENFFNIRGDEILYIGDHIFSDVQVTKKMLRWRTALVVRELEKELEAIEEFVDEQKLLSGWMQEKEEWEYQHARLRMEVARLQSSDQFLEGQSGLGNDAAGALSGDALSNKKALLENIENIKQKLFELDEKIAPMAKKASVLAHPRWGPLMRAGNDQSHLAMQVERNADIYMSRVSNLFYQTPFAYFRYRKSSLPHDLMTFR